MKFLKFLSVFLAAAFIFTACEKEYSYEDGTAKGTLKKDDATNDCLPQTVNGAYVKDTTLKAATNYVDLQVNITETGAYDIRTDTVNGYYFRGSGSAANTGLTMVRLTGYGKPIAASVDEFTVAFDTSHCTFSVQVLATPASAGKFTLGVTAGACTGATLAGTYTAASPTTAANTASVNITINQTGSYNVVSTSAADNGVTFSGSGNFPSTGAATLVLTAQGTPAATGTFTYNLSDGTNTCSFTVTYTAAAPPATYTIDCTGATFTGTYQAGAAATGNTVTISATPSSTGSYNITTVAANGVSFAGTGTFTTTGAPVPVTLTATGTAGATTGPVSYTATAVGVTPASSCTFNVTYTAGAGPAAFTINCGTAVVNGDYYRGQPLGVSNTIVLPVTVTTAGSWSVTTTANGVTFSGTGTFPNTNAGQTITLTGTGTSTTGGTVTFTTTGATTNCSFDVVFDFVDFTIAGNPALQMNFYDTAQYFTNPSLPGYTILEAYGASNAASDDEIYLDIARTSAPPFATGTYTASGTGYLLAADYIDAAGTDYTTYPGGPAGPFTIILTTSTATRIIGTYSGTLTDETGGGTKNVSGSFNLKLH